jgi:hypothetical protein
VALPLFIVLLVVLDANEGTTWHAAVYFAVAGIMFYQRLGHHMRDVAHPRVRSNPTPEPDAQDSGTRKQPSTPDKSREVSGWSGLNNHQSFFKSRDQALSPDPKTFDGRK